MYNIQNAEKPVDDHKCKTIVTNLLRSLSTAQTPQTSSFFVRELFQTQRCDTILQTEQLLQLRNEYSNFIGKDHMDHIISYKVDDEDEARCTQAVLHYNDWTSTALLKQLPWYSRYWLTARTNAESLFAVVGIVTSFWATGTGVSVMVKESGEWIKKSRDAKAKSATDLSSKPKAEAPV